MTKPATEKRYKYQILLAEDEAELSEVLCAGLQERGAKVIACNSVAWAQQKLSNQKFDIIVFDINLIDGVSSSLIEHIRTQEYSNLNMETPILVISGFLDSNVLKGILPYIQGALVKPFTIEDMLKKVEQVAKRAAA